jgi:hypothetical protein
LKVVYSDIVFSYTYRFRYHMEKETLSNQGRFGGGDGKVLRRKEKTICGVEFSKVAFILRYKIEKLS